MGELQLLVFIATAALVALVGVGLSYWSERQKLARLSPEERERYRAEQAKRKRAAAERAQEEQLTEQWGPTNPAMICPHCQAQGKTRTRPVCQKKGISGGKATAAVLTGGWSILATGLSRKETATQAHCDNCNNVWTF